MNPLSGLKRKFCLFLTFCTFFAGVLPAVAQSVLVPNDAFYREQEYLQTIGALETWAVTTGSSSVIVAVLDTGVDLNHPDIKGNIWRNPNEIAGDGLDNDHNGFIDDLNGWDFVTSTNDPSPKFTSDANPGGMNHGTIVAGIIGAMGNNALGIAGLNWSAKILPVRVLDGSGFGVTSKVDDAIRYAVKMGAKVINLSFTSETPSPAIEQAIADAYAQGVVVVTAAGNDLFGNGLDLNAAPIFPACVGGLQNNIILAVASTDRYDRKASFSNFGSGCVDISAPGENIFGAQFTSALVAGYSDQYGGGWSGTSVSAPMVSGAAALLKAYAPQINARDVMGILMATANPIDAMNPEYAGKLGAGRLNIKAALARLMASPPRTTVRAVRFVIGRGAGGSPLVNVLDGQGLLVSSFQPYDRKFLGGVRVAVGDVDGDGQDEIVTAPGAGGGPHIKVYEMNGTPISEFYAYATKFLGGANLAVGDVDGDGKAEIITGAGPGGGPHVKVFRASGKEIGSFMAFATNFKGGVSVAAADVDGDGVSEIVTGMYSGGKKIRSFNKDGALYGVYPDPAFVTDGLVLSGYDLDGDRRSEVVIGQRKGGSAFGVMRYDGVMLATLRTQDAKYLGGISLAAGASTLGGEPRFLLSLALRQSVAVYNLEGTLQSQFQAFPTATTGAMGVAIGFVDVEQ